MDAQGTLWFTMQSGHVGRLVPQTEEMTTSATPTSGACPCGILVNPPGRALARRLSRQPNRQHDPQTVEITEYALPHPGVIRHMMAAPDGDLMLACSAVNRIAPIEIET